jgi:hypothetical protein
MINLKPNSDGAGFYRTRSNGHEGQLVGSAQCGNLAEVTANSTFVVAQTTYYEVPVLPGPQFPPPVKQDE